MYDPNYPATNALIESAPMRDQFNGLKSLIDAVPTITDAQVDGVNTLPPDQQAGALASVSGGVLHLSFDLPRGEDGAAGEVTLAQLSDALLSTSNNSNAVATLGLTVSDPPTQAEVQQIADKLDELIGALRR